MSGLWDAVAAVNAQQVRLFELPADPLVRRDDPETSRVAAVTVRRNVREDEVRNALRVLVTASTSHDISDLLGTYGLQRPSNTVSRRLTSLERQGVVRRCGVKTGPYGQPCTLWRLT